MHAYQRRVSSASTLTVVEKQAECLHAVQRALLGRMHPGTYLYVCQFALTCVSTLQLRPSRRRRGIPGGCPRRRCRSCSLAATSTCWRIRIRGRAGWIQRLTSANKPSSCQRGQMSGRCLSRALVGEAQMVLKTAISSGHGTYASPTLSCRSSNFK